jgi:ribosomal protein S18 acetylase RimI-like enzyme
VTLPSNAGRPGELTPAVNRWLALHEARCHALAGREVRELGDAVLLHDPADREPFWNRVAGIAWPEPAAAFDRRLAEVLALFAGLDRIPHVWPTPGYDEPPDLVARLLANGFEDLGSGLVMVLDPMQRAASAGSGAAGRTAAVSPRVEITHLERPEDPAAAARAVAMVLVEAFAVEDERREAIERETEILFGRDEVHVCLLRVDGEPAAVVRRSTFDGTSYLSSIGTRPIFRGMGLGRLVTDIAVEEALAAGSRWTYLGVFSDNAVALRMYEGLGFEVVGGPAPDLLLRR